MDNGNNCYIADGTWSDSDASSILTNGPTYKNGSLTNPVGLVWADIDPSNSNTPWIFSTFGYSPYTTTLTTTFSQTIKPGESTISSLDPTGHTYTIISINNSLPSVYPTISIVSSNDVSGGKIQTSLTTPAGSYQIKIMQNSDYTMTDFVLILKSIKPINPDTSKCYIVNMDMNDKFTLKYEKCEILKKPLNGTLYVNKKNKLVYVPNKNYVGNDYFALLHKNKLLDVNSVINYYIKIL